MYNIIFDDINMEALRKFLKIIDDKTIKQNGKKEDIISQIKDKLNEDEAYHKSFRDYFKEIEKGGRKDFWFYKLKVKLTAEEIVKLKESVNKIKKEDDTLYIPVEDDTPYYFNVSKSDDVIEVKAIRKKKVKAKGPTRVVMDGDDWVERFKMVDIRHVGYYKLDLSRKILIFGVDVWKSLTTKQKLVETQKDIEYIFGHDFWSKIEVINIDKKAEHLLKDAPHVITKESKEKIIDQQQSTIFALDTERLSVIKKALNDGKVLLKDIKTTYIESDVRDNKVFQAAATESIELLTKGGKAAMFYYSDLTNEYDFLKFELFVSDARIKFSNDDLTLSDLENVFSQII